MGLMIPAEAKQALQCLKSIDISLGRIAAALEKQNGIESNNEQKPKKESAVSIKR